MKDLQHKINSLLMLEHGVETSKDVETKRRNLKKMYDLIDSIQQSCEIEKGIISNKLKYETD